MASEELHEHLRQSEAVLRSAVEALKNEGLHAAVEIASAYKERALALIGLEADAIRMEQMEATGANQVRIASLSAEEVILSGKVIGQMDFESIYRNVTRAVRIPPAHVARVIEPMAKTREMLRIVIARQTPDEPEELPELPKVS